MSENIILSLINILPQWFIMVGIALFALHKICDKNIKLFMRLIGKWKSREERNSKIKNEEQDRVISENRKAIIEVKQEITNINSKIDLLLGLIKKDFKNEK